MTTKRFDTLVALSDLLVLTACQRAYSRAITRRTKFVPMRERHRAYEDFPIPEDKIEAALEDAWSLCALVNHRNDLRVDVEAWTATLDGYTRALLMMSVPHSPTQLRNVLAERLAPREQERLSAAS